MSPISIVMMLLFMAIIWGGLLFALVRVTRVGLTEAALDVNAQPEYED
ncbi:MAG: methionine/alanine import family NSS transporter small subunit [Dermatophilus congolensis]|nr:methionine/alanine import family NSS transporter small subunit [Dermatophilus congolensis]